jgi:hypothetical protein
MAGGGAEGAPQEQPPLDGARAVAPHAHSVAPLPWPSEGAAAGGAAQGLRGQAGGGERASLLLLHQPPRDLCQQQH